jgi:predicted DNA-binding transcriptional regulator AlpA
VMTAAKTKQAARMVTAGTPLTEVADVLGVSRTTLYRHLKATQSTGVVSAPAQSLPPVVVLRASVVGERSVRACPSCGDEPRTREEAMALRADLAVRWLHPDPQSVPLSNRWDAEASMLRSDSWPGPATAIATYSGSEDRRFGSVIVASALTPHASYVDFGAPLAAAERAPGDTTPLLADDGDHPSLSGPDPNAGTLLTAIITTSGVPVAVG